MKPPTYKTSRFILKPYRRDDETRFIEIAGDPQSVRFMGDSTRESGTEEYLFQNIFKIYARSEKRWCWIWGIYDDENLLGHIELKESEHTAEDELEIVYMVHPKERGKGVMTEILNFFKENQSLWNRKIIATVDMENIRSISLLENWGIVNKEIIEEPETGEHYFKFRLQELSAG